MPPKKNNEKFENEYSNHHFVPKSFLKNFCGQNGVLQFSQFLNQQRVWTKPKDCHISQICRIKDYYDLDDSNRKMIGGDQKFIEKNLFWYERYFFNNLKMLLECHTLFSFNDILNIAWVFMSMKQRNPKHREGFTLENILKMLPKSQDKIRNEMEKRGFPKELIEIGVNYGIEKITTEPDISKTMHNSAILQNGISPSGNTVKAISILLSCNIFIYYIEESNEMEFITTDNPFFSLDKNNITHHMKFIDDKMHILPFTNRFAIIFSRKNPLDRSEEIKIEYRKANESLITSINAESARNRNMYIYCQSRDYLNSFLSTIKKLNTKK